MFEILEHLLWFGIDVVVSVFGRFSSDMARGEIYIMLFWLHAYVNFLGI